VEPLFSGQKALKNGGVSNSTFRRLTIMPKWDKTPFKTIKSAHRVAVRLEMQPSTVITDKGFRTFQMKEGRTITVIAQRVEGGPVLEKRLLKGKKSKIPLQDPNAPKFSEEDRLLTGPWTTSAYKTFEAVREHYSALGPSTKHREAFSGELLVVDYPDGDVIEYRQQAGHMVEQRMLFSAQGRYLAPYSKAEFLAACWKLSEYEDFDAVTAYWKAQFVNFDNVEVLEIVMYRIGRDEYEYFKNQEGIWSRVLEGVKEAK